MNKNNKEKESIISSFKKFSEMAKDKNGKTQEYPNLTELPFDDGDLPANPNLPNKTGKVEKPMNNNYMMPSGQKVDPDKEENVNEDKIEFYGKVAKLPKGLKASKGYNFLENVKVSKSSIWYIMVEKQNNELQMVKYNHKKGVDLSKFVGDLKEYYKNKFSGSPKLIKMIESIDIDGNDKYSWVKNIPLIEIEGKKMITKITEDLIKLLSK